MEAPIVTNRVFADTLEKMLQEMPLEKVRIEEHCRRCGAATRSFYYHFKDKYDLAAWIYITDLNDVFGNGLSPLTPGKTEFLLQRINRRRSFCRKVLMDQSQNSVFSYI